MKWRSAQECSGGGSPASRETSGLCLWQEHITQRMSVAFMWFSISLLDLSIVLEHQGRKEQASSQRKGESPEHAGLYLALAFIRSPERMGHPPFPQQIQKNPTSSIKTWCFVGLFNCIKKPLCDVLAVV